MTIPIPVADESVAIPSVEELSACLLNKSGKVSLPARFRALFTLRGLNSDEAVEIIGKAFEDKSALLKHELAYVLGQMRRPSAIPVLNAVLCNLEEEPMVRHEAAEALGAIGCQESVPILQQFLNDPAAPVRETCEIAINLILHPEQTEEPEVAVDGELSFGSVDPAPALKTHKTIEQLQAQLMDTSLDLYHRYKAMFALRNRGTSEEAVLALCTGFADNSALFRHEVAYVLGQLQHPASIPALAQQLRRTDEIGMVRHECAEALGSIATPECLDILKEFLQDEEDVVRESCIVACDMCEYENSSDLHFYP